MHFLGAERLCHGATRELPSARVPSSFQIETDDAIHASCEFGDNWASEMTSGAAAAAASQGHDPRVGDRSFVGQPNPLAVDAFVGKKPRLSIQSPLPSISFPTYFFLIPSWILLTAPNEDCALFEKTT